MSSLLAQSLRAGATDLSMTFDEEPVDLTTFVRDKKFMFNPPLSLVQYDAVRHLEQILYPATYALMAEQFGPYWKPVRFITEASILWGKGCYRNTAMIYNAYTGDWSKVDDLTEPGFAASQDPATGRSSTQIRSSFIKVGRGPCYRVTTANGRSSEVFEGHQFLTGSKDNQPEPFEWKQLRTLRVGDKIAASSSIPEPMASEPMDPRELELLGFWLGDGCMPKTKSGGSLNFMAATHEPYAIERYYELCRDIQPEATIRQITYPHPRNCVRIWTVAPLESRRGRDGGNNALRNICYKYGMSGARYDTKRVPKAVFRVDNDQLRLFISRLWGTDGHVCQFDKMPEIAYTTVSRGLAEDVQNLLLRLSIRSEIQTKNVKYVKDGIEQPRRIAYVVRIRDVEMVERFCKQITLLDKQDKLDEVLAWCAGHNKRRRKKGDLYLDKITSIEFIGDHDYYDCTVDTTHNYISSQGLVNHNSGKDHVVRIAVARVAYLLLCLRNPQRYFGMPAQDSIHMLNVASSTSQANRAFFEPLRRAMTRKGCWFESRADDKDQSIKYAKQLEAISGHSGADTQEGLNLIFGLADEIAAFRTREEAARFARGSERQASNTAESIMEMMRSSATSRFPEGNWKVAAISFPRFKGDSIMRLTDEGRADNKLKGAASTWYVSGPLATWEVNPRVRGREQFQSDYDKDPDNARGKYECDPPSTSNAYIRNHQALGEAFSGVKAADPVSITYAWGTRGDDKVPGWQASFRLDPSLIPIAGASYAVHGDIGITTDAAGVAMCHVSRYEEREWRSFDEEGEQTVTTEHRPFVKMDFCAAFTADIAAQPQAREVRISWYRDLCMELIHRGFNIILYTFDGFQSTDSMQLLKAQGIEAYRVSTDLNDEPYKGLRDLIYEGRLEGYYDETVVRELKQLRRTAQGKIDHPPNGSKDTADAVACSALGAIKIGGSEVETGEEATHRSAILPMSLSPTNVPEGFDLHAPSLNDMWLP